MAGVQVIQYLVDTRPLWPEAKKTAELTEVASDALAFLTAEERTKVLKYYFVADAKMALASHLAKHWVVSRHCGVAWRESRLSRDDHGKPIYVDGGRQPVSFNVSHQAGLVSLVAVHGYGGEGDEDSVDVGTDVVCTSERRDRDRRMVREKGWAEFVDIHSEVFGRSEVAYLKAGRFPGAPAASSHGADDVDHKLRCFYTLWCLREAYVKMTGEALLAPWLQDLEFRDFGAPVPGSQADVFSTARLERQPEGEVLSTTAIDATRLEVWFKGARVSDEANVCLRSVGPDYMTCSAVRTSKCPGTATGWTLGPYRWLSLEEMIADAEEAGGP